MKEKIILGDYKFESDNYNGDRNGAYKVYLHNEYVRSVWFVADITSLNVIYSDDTGLIALLLLMYQPSYDFSIYPRPATR